MVLPDKEIIFYPIRISAPMLPRYRRRLSTSRCFPVHHHGRGSAAKKRAPVLKWSLAHPNAARDLTHADFVGSTTRIIEQAGRSSPLRYSHRKRGSLRAKKEISGEAFLLSGKRFGLSRYEKNLSATDRHHPAGDEACYFRAGTCLFPGAAGIGKNAEPLTVRLYAGGKRVSESLSTAFKVGFSPERYQQLLR